MSCFAKVMPLPQSSTLIMRCPHPDAFTTSRWVSTSCLGFFEDAGHPRRAPAALPFRARRLRFARCRRRAASRVRLRRDRREVCPRLRFLMDGSRRPHVFLIPTPLRLQQSVRAHLMLLEDRPSASLNGERRGERGGVPCHMAAGGARSYFPDMPRYPRSPPALRRSLVSPLGGQ